MHSLKFRRRAYIQPAAAPKADIPKMVGDEAVMTSAELKEAGIATLQILSIGVLSGVCCFTGTLLMAAIIQ